MTNESAPQNPLEAELEKFTLSYPGLQDRFYSLLGLTEAERKERLSEYMDLISDALKQKYQGIEDEELQALMVVHEQRFKEITDKIVAQNSQKD